MNNKNFFFLFFFLYLFSISLAAVDSPCAWPVVLVSVSTVLLLSRMAA